MYFLSKNWFCNESMEHVTPFELMFASWWLLVHASWMFWYHLRIYILYRNLTGDSFLNYLAFHIMLMGCPSAFLVNSRMRWLHWTITDSLNNRFFFSILTQAAFIWGPTSDTYLMFCNADFSLSGSVAFIRPLRHWSLTNVTVLHWDDMPPWLLP